jgi:7-keto-8-aminopelargonate synthetase-like enzyme
VGHTADRLAAVDTMITETVRAGLTHRTAEDEKLCGRTVRIGGRDLVNFGSCSYLGLELDPRLVEGAIEATRRFGTQFSSSRAYLSAPPYAELEEMLCAVFEAHALVTPSTTLGHLAAIPTLIDERDAVILDHQVHNSVQLATRQLQPLGTHVELLRHSRVDLLEERIRELRQGHRHVWYMADSVYSMFGDVAPLAELASLGERHEQLHLYLDDAHGMSWSGRNGRGVALDCIPLHPRMIVATSLNKSFGAAGGALVFADPETRRKVKTCGATMIFSGPVQPPMLGAALASARIHLSDEIYTLQGRLRERFDTCNELLSAVDLPVPSSPDAPVRFVGVGLPRAAQKMTARLMEHGFYVNCGHFPAVPVKQSGVRFSLNLHQTEDDVGRLVDAIARNFDAVVAEDAESVQAVWSAFRLESPEGGARRRSVHPRPPPGVRERRRARRGRRGGAQPRTAFRIERSDTIEKIPPDVWNRCLGARGSFTWEGLHFLEQTFRRNPDPENDWRFRYYRVLDAEGRTRLATFFSDALWKADMLESAAVSREIEKLREKDPHYLVSRAFGMGSLLTEGNHLFLDPETRRPGASEWRDLMALLLKSVGEDAEALGAESIVLRDLPSEDPEMDALLLDHGFSKLPAPDSMVAELHWQDEEALLRGLTRKFRRHQIAQVQPWNDTYGVEIFGAGTRAPTPDQLERFYQLYRNVKAKSFELNTFPLPHDIFARMNQCRGWELLALHVRPGAEADAPDGPVAVVACFVGDDRYVPTLVGLDYRFVGARGLYRQCLRHILLRAKQKGLGHVLFGMGAPLEKRRFGAKPEARSYYVRADDHYSFDVIAQISARS